MLRAMPAAIPGIGALSEYKEGEFHKQLAVAGGVVGALVGALLWGLIGKATGRELKWAAELLGALAGFGVLLMGKGRGQVPAILGGIFAALGLILGKILLSLWVLVPLGIPAVRYHLTVIDFVFLAVTVGIGVFIPAGDKVRGVVTRLMRRGKVAP